MRLFTPVDPIWLDFVLRVSSYWASQISYVVIEICLRMLSFWAVQMCFYPIAAKDIRTLEAAHALIDDDRYNMVR